MFYFVLKLKFKKVVFSKNLKLVVVLGDKFIDYMVNNILLIQNLIVYALRA